MFTCVLQMGGAIGAAILTSIQTSVQTSPTSFSGRAAGLWFLVAFLGVMPVLLLVFMKDSVGTVVSKADGDGDGDGVGEVESSAHTVTKFV